MENEEEKSQEERIEELCQKIFGKPSKDVKYVMATNYIHHQLLQEELARTGLYQWLNVFRGHVKYPKEITDYNDYDIVQVNLSAQDVHIIGDIRSKLGKNSKTKLVVNNDYTTEAWGQAFEYLSTLEREVQGADLYFGTEYYQTSALTELVGKKCFVIPHPADVKRLKSLPKVPQKNIISTIWRRYDNFSYVPSLAVRNQGMTTQLIGYDANRDRRKYLTTTLYDFVLLGTNYFEFCDQLAESKIIYDPFTFHSYSRTTVDTAALGVAVVGSNRTQSANICYPYTTIDPYDITKARELISKLLTDEDFYKKVVDTAKEKSEYYSHINSKERYLQALYESLNTKDEKKKGIERGELVKGRGDDVLISVGKQVNRDEKTKEDKRENIQ